MWNRNAADDRDRESPCASPGVNAPIAIAESVVTVRRSHSHGRPYSQFRDSRANAGTRGFIAGAFREHASNRARYSVRRTPDRIQTCTPELATQSIVVNAGWQLQPETLVNRFHERTVECRAMNRL
jgi:hypothetical protein